MSETPPRNAPSRSTPDTHQRGADKVARIPIKVEPAAEVLRKPAWIRAKAPVGPGVARIKATPARGQARHGVRGGQLPEPGRVLQPRHRHLHDPGRCLHPPLPLLRRGPRPAPAGGPGGAGAPGRSPSPPWGCAMWSSPRWTGTTCATAAPGTSPTACGRCAPSCPQTRLEVLVPDFRGRQAIALDQFQGAAVPDVFNHNLETVPRLYAQARPGADYQGSLDLLAQFKSRHPGVPTKSGLMLGLGEECEEVLAVMADLRAHGCDLLTLGQYLQPSRDHLPVRRYWTPGGVRGPAADRRGHGLHQCGERGHGPLLLSRGPAGPGTGRRVTQP